MCNKNVFKILSQQKIKSINCKYPDYGTVNVVTFTQLQRSKPELNLPLTRFPTHATLALVHLEIGGAHRLILGFVRAVQGAGTPGESVVEYHATRAELAVHEKARIGRHRWRRVQDGRWQ